MFDTLFPDVSKKNQLSEVFRNVKIDYHDDRKPSKLTLVEAFTSFIKVEDSSAIGLHKLIMNFIQQKGLDSPAVMSGKYSDLHKKIQDVAPHAYYVHCDSHNFNFALKDAMEDVIETDQFYDAIESICNCFAHTSSIV